MSNGKYLNEENYERGKKKILRIARIVLIVGLLIGGTIIAIGVINQTKDGTKERDISKAELSAQLETEKQNLIQTKAQLEEKIKPIEDEIKSLERVEFNGFDDDYYAREDKIAELKKSIATDQSSILIIDALINGSFNWCDFERGENNQHTANYCSIKNQLYDIDRTVLHDNSSFDSLSCYIFGSFIIIGSGMISGFIFMFAKRREIASFTAQQVMPVAQEGIEIMAPTIGNAAGEIAKGIKKGLNDADKKED